MKIKRHVHGAPQRLHRLDHLPALLRAHAGGRLVEQQHLGIQRQREADIEQLLVAMAEIAADDPGDARQLQHLHDLAGARHGRPERKRLQLDGLAALMRLHRRRQRLLDRSVGNRLATWKARPMPRRTISRRSRPAMSSPASRMRPASGAKRPVIRLNKVVLPAPLGPMMALKRAVGELERDVAGGRDAAERLGQALRASAWRPALHHGACHACFFPPRIGRVARPLGHRLTPALEALGDHIERAFAQAQHEDEDHDAQHELGMAGLGDGDIGQQAQDHGADQRAQEH